MTRVLGKRHLDAILRALESVPSQGNEAAVQAYEALNEFLLINKGGSAAPRAVLLTKFEAQSLSRAAGNSLPPATDDREAADILGSPSRVEAAHRADAAMYEAGHRLS